MAERSSEALTGPGERPASQAQHAEGEQQPRYEQPGKEQQPGHGQAGQEQQPDRARRASRARRVGLAAGAAVLAVGGAAAIAVAVTAAHRPAAAAGPRVATAAVVRTDLTNTVQEAGSLAYAGSFTVVNQEQGTAYTVLPRPGQVIRRGQRLYEVDGGPVVLFYGRRPEWRALSLGVADGPDVAQLDANLIALGYATAATLPVSHTFTSATTAAVEQWQAATGQVVSGVVAAGQVAYAPGPLRVTSVSAGLGAPVQPGATVLTATSPRPVVEVALPVSQEYLVHRGEPVTVTMPDGATTGGRVAAISTVATGAASGASPGPPGAPGASPGPGGPGGTAGGGAAGATVNVVVVLTHPAVAGHLDQAPVTVSIVSHSVHGVLAVPVSALVALAGGGYAVEVDRGGSLHLVAVNAGLFGQTLVQVTGSGLRPGTRVEVPAP
jgi:peptidoglycan hydrolase-like protein with peptidoglycan-binding domain